MVIAAGLRAAAVMAQEVGLAPKRAWTTAKMSERVMARMMWMILPFRLTIATVEGTWKLN